MVAIAGNLQVAARTVRTAVSEYFDDEGGNHSAVAVAPVIRGRRTANASSKPSDRETIALTGKQKVALMLEKAGYTHAFIAKRLKLRHRQSATALLARARRAEDAIRKTVIEFFQDDGELGDDAAATRSAASRPRNPCAATNVRVLPTGVAERDLS